MNGTVCGVSRSRVADWSVTDFRGRLDAIPCRHAPRRGMATEWRRAATGNPVAAPSRVSGQRQ